MVSKAGRFGPEPAHLGVERRGHLRLGRPALEKRLDYSKCFVRDAGGGRYPSQLARVLSLAKVLDQPLVGTNSTPRAQVCLTARWRRPTDVLGFDAHDREILCQLRQDGLLLGGGRSLHFGGRAPARLSSSVACVP